MSPVLVAKETVDVSNKQHVVSLERIGLESYFDDVLTYAFFWPGYFPPYHSVHWISQRLATLIPYHGIPKRKNYMFRESRGKLGFGLNMNCICRLTGCVQ